MLASTIPSRYSRTPRFSGLCLRRRSPMPAALTLASAGVIASPSALAEPGPGDDRSPEAVGALELPIFRTWSDAGCTQVVGRAAAPAVEAIADLQDELERRPGPRIAVGSARGGFDVQYELGPSIQNDPDFIAGLEQAAEFWEAIIDDPVTVVVSADLVTDQPFIAAAGSSRENIDYPTLRTALIGDAGPEEATYLNSILAGVITIQRDNGSYTTASDPTFRLTTANLRALGRPEGVTSQDASIVFNTDFDFDTDPADGIDPGAVDLVYVMIHEIGHVLGFVSGVDFDSPPSALDAFRFPDEDEPGNPDGFFGPGGGTIFRELRRGAEALLDTIGAVPDAPLGMRFSTGRTGGDGRQASHWKDDALLGLPFAIGVMDPTYDTDRIPPGVVTTADRTAFSIIGWNLTITPAPNCPEDISGDGVVDVLDLNLLLGVFNAPAGELPDADITGDGVIDVLDLNQLLASFNAACD